MKLNTVVSGILCSCALLSACSTNNFPSVDLWNPTYLGMTKQSNADILDDLMVLDKNIIASARLAKEKAVNPSVRRFAAYLCKSHHHDLKQLRHLAHKLHVKPTSSSVATSLENRGAQKMQYLRSLNGAAFDRAYVDCTIKDHEEALRLIDNVLMKDATSPALKRHLKSERHEIMMHLEKARALQKHLG